MKIDRISTPRLYSLLSSINDVCRDSKRLMTESAKLAERATDLKIRFLHEIEHLEKQKEVA